MAQITKISISFGHTKNLGNFESLRADCSIESTVEPGETVEDVTTRLYKVARVMVRQELYPEEAADE